MAKQNVGVKEAVAAAFSVQTPVFLPSPPTPLIPYPPPRGSSLGYSINKKLLKHLEIGGGGSGGGGGVNTWVEALKASSPTHIKGTSINEQQMDWMVHHPSALGMFEEIVNASGGKKIAVFLDYDGTLSPIVDDPEKAFMSDKMRDAVRRVALCFPTAIVSGRSRDKVYEFVRLPELYYAGSHGMDIKGPSSSTTRFAKDDKEVHFQPSSEYISMMDEVYKTLTEKAEEVPGATVENNKFCLSVHFRRVDEKKWSGLAEQVDAVLGKYSNLRITKGRKVLEIRPDIKWDKGKALEFLLESLGFADREDVLPVYVGDDRTDEDAFKVLQVKGQGFGILVSKMPKETKASYSLQDPSEVMEFLGRLAEWKKMEASKGT